MTLAFSSARHFPGREAAPYVLAQLAGAILASLALRGLFGFAGGLGATHPSHVGLLRAVGLEAGLTAVLMIVILAVATDTGPWVRSPPSPSAARSPWRRW